MILMRYYSELHCDVERSQNVNQEVTSNDNDESMTIGIIGCAVGLVLIVLLIVLFVCRFNKKRRDRDVIRMIKMYEARSRAAAFGLNQIDAVTEKEGIDVSDVT